MTENRKILRVLVAPFADDNLYQTLLYAGVSRSDCIVKMVRYSQLALPFWILGRWDVLHLHWVEPFYQRASVFQALLFAALFQFSLLIARLRGIPVVWTLHQMKSHDGSRKWLGEFMTRSVCGVAKRVIVHAPSVADLAVRSLPLDPGIISVIPHGHYIGAYPDTVSRAEARVRLDVPADTFVFVFVGQVRAYKGIDDLVGAFARLNLPDATLIIAGKLVPNDPEVRERYSKAVPGIRFHLRFIPDEDLQVYLRAADVMVLPYRNIVTSGSVILGMSFGLPCVVPRSGSIPEVIPSEGAFFFEPGDVAGLEEAMLGAWNDRARLPERGRINLAAARTLDWDVIGAETRSVYDQV